MKNFYKILNVDRDAKNLSIKKAFRKLAKELHPDVNKSENAHIAFLEINEAYKVLSNPIKRLQYNKLYDYQIANITLKNKKKYHNNHEKWERHVDNSAKKGRKKGEKYTHENDKKFQKRAEKWDNSTVYDFFSFLFEVLVEGVFRVLIEFIISI